MIIVVGNKIIFNSNFSDDILSYFSSLGDSIEISDKKIVEHIGKKPWTLNEFKKQNWGHNFHSIAPYIGRIKPSFAHWLIKLTTNSEDTVLDPFCGVGTVPLQADFLKRKAIGFDLNDYAITITKAKFDRRSLENNLNWLDEIKLEPQKIKLSNVSEYIKQFYHPKTLKEILSLKEKIIQSKRHFLLGCLIGIVHGHRPQYLSAWTGYIIPFSPNTLPEYKEVIPRLRAKITRMHSDNISKSIGSIIKKQDAKKISLPKNSVDIVITSPPYFDTIDYVTSNRLRLAMLGISDDKSVNLKSKLIQKQKTYLDEMKIVGEKLHYVLKNNSYCIFVLGDVHKPNGSRNTALEVSEIYSTLGYKTLKIIDDEIPISTRTATKWKGKKDMVNTKQKLDRILIMKVEK